jgi:hypothetical protein
MAQQLFARDTKQLAPVKFGSMRICLPKTGAQNIRFLLSSHSAAPNGLACALCIVGAGRWIKRYFVRARVQENL